MPLDRDTGLAWLHRTLPDIEGHAAVRAAAKDWATYSSELQGDADVRDYRQIPLEIDPPDHVAYRALLLPYFGRVEVAAMEPRFRDVARDLVARFQRAGHGDGVHDLAFPMVLHSLAIAFGRDADLEEWASWGLETWITRPDGSRDGSHLDRYLDRVVDAALAARDADGDVFARLAASRIDDRALTRTELLGLCNLVLAGGRDTVIKLISCALWHLATTPTDRAWLAADRARIPRAIEELLRYMSPLPRMEREVRMPPGGPSACPFAPGTRLRLSFISANHDPAVFAEPGRICLDRQSNHHVAFGAGPHTCVGAHLAKVQTRIFLEELLVAAPEFSADGEADLTWHTVHDTRLPLLFRHLPIRLGNP